MQAQIKRLPAAEKPVARVLVTFVLAAMAVRHAAAQTVLASPVQPEHRRRIVVSIPHRKLALIEDGKVKKMYPVAVGAANSPSPSGTFEVKNRLVSPTYYHPGKVIPAGANNPFGHALDRSEHQGIWHPRHERRELDRQSCLARMHSHAP